MTKPLKFEIQQRLEAVIHLEGLPADREAIAIWTVRLPAPRIVAMIQAARKEQRITVPSDG